VSAMVGDGIARTSEVTVTFDTGVLQVMSPTSLAGAALVALAQAWLIRVGQFPTLVGAVTTALNEAPAARIPCVHESVCALIWHPSPGAGGTPGAGTIDHVTDHAKLDGSGSLTVTPQASPGP
jgi:hypothetical protein